MRRFIDQYHFIWLLFCGFGFCFLVAQSGATAQADVQPADDSRRLVDSRFGAIESFWAPEEAAELKVGWERILFYWNEIQPTGPDDWNPLHVLDEWLIDANVQGRTVLGLLKNTPAWATDGEPFSGVPRGLYLPIDDPDNLWAGYVRKVVDYYGPRGVHHWIIWNEPEIAPGVYGHEFGGSIEDYYQLLKVAHKVAKENDPLAVIHLAGWSYWHDPNYLRDFLEVARADPEAVNHDYFFDVISLHIYFRVETVQTLVEETDQIQREFGLDKPIWINETNTSPNLDELWPVERPQFQVDLDQQAWYVVQAHALGFAAGVERIAIYKLVDILLPPGGESFGILRPDFSKRPAYFSYLTTLRYLNGFTFPVEKQQRGSYFIFTFRRPEGITRVLWARTPSSVTVEVPALAESGLLVSALGDSASIRPDDGFYTITLEGARCRGECLVGGPPLFLVEGSVGDVELIPTAAPSTRVVETPTPIPTGTHTPTPSPTFTPSPTTTPSPTATATSLPTETPEPSPTIITEAVIAELPGPPNPPLAGGGEGAADARNSQLQPAWLFIGAGVVLSLVLAVYARRSQGGP
jgi:hypothetical protein